jgi:SAM-dependent methyltransferase
VSELHNRTRRSRSIPLSLLRRGRVLDIPLYYVLRTSDLAREGLDHSGSYRFADHIYRGEPSGRGSVGRWLDRRLLNLPAARAFRFRYLAAREELARFLTVRSMVAGNEPIHVLSVPCGIPRELADAAADVAPHFGQPPPRIVFHGLDLDESALVLARQFMRDRGLDEFRTHRGDALERRSYPDRLDFVTCTGLTEFLEDEDVARLFAVIFDVLRPGGCFVTSGMRRRWTTEYLLTLGELRTHYRNEAALRQLLAPLAFSGVSARADDTGLQTVVVARK